jgi:hypothetical protein
MQYFYIHSLPIPSSYYCTIQQYSLYLLQQTSTKITKEIDDGIFLTSDERDTISSTTLSYLGTQSLSNLLLVTIPVAKPYAVVVSNLKTLGCMYCIYNMYYVSMYL